jgi:hypothetical protein
MAFSCAEDEKGKEQRKSSEGSERNRHPEKAQVYQALRQGRCLQHGR